MLRSKILFEMGRRFADGVGDLWTAQEIWPYDDSVRESSPRRSHPSRVRWPPALQAEPIRPSPRQIWTCSSAIQPTLEIRATGAEFFLPAKGSLSERGRILNEPCT